MGKHLLGKEKRVGPIPTSGSERPRAPDTRHGYLKRTAIRALYIVGFLWYPGREALGTVNSTGSSGRRLAAKAVALQATYRRFESYRPYAQGLGLTVTH